MSEKRILLASLLKPVNDTRMYEKLGLSLSALPLAQVHLCGFNAPLPAAAPTNVHFHPRFKFKRLSWGRAKAQGSYLRLLQQVQPHLLIVCTHELLPVSAWYAAKNKIPLVYDVQENYALNLKAQHNYAPWLKQLLAWGVNKIETLLAKHVNHYLVAEQSYVQELSFLRPGNYTLLENKYKRGAGYQPPRTPVAIPAASPLKLLYSGTISELYGVFEAIAFADAVQQKLPGTTLTIIGYSPGSHVWQQVRELAQHKPFLHLIGGDELVPHQQILQHIAQCQLGLLPYQPNASTFRCIPTKLYEYIAHALPMVVQQNPLWHSIILRHQAGISIDFAGFKVNNVLHQLQHTTFYTAGVPEGAFWETEDKILLPLITSLLGRS